MQIKDEPMPMQPTPACSRRLRLPNGQYTVRVSPFPPPGWEIVVAEDGVEELRPLAPDPARRSPYEWFAI